MEAIPPLGAKGLELSAAQIEQIICDMEIPVYGGKVHYYEVREK